MSMSLFFWILMLLWLVLGAGPAIQGGVRGIGAALLPWAAVACLGWHAFGPIVQ